MRAELLRIERLEERRVLATAAFSIGNASISQPPQGGTVNMNFTVTRTGETLSTVTVGYATQNGTATAGSDYTAKTGTLTFLPGQTSAVISIPILRDATNASAQNFQVKLTGITNVVGAVPTLGNKTDFSAGTNPTSVALADVNGDGKQDLVVGHYQTANVSVFLNTTAPGAAAPTFAVEQNFTTLANPRSVALADLNGDGRADLVVTNTQTNTPKVSVLLNTTTAGAATASFATKQDFDVGSIPYAVTPVDLNGDGKLDLATANFGTDNVSVLLNTTTAGSSTVSFAARADLAVSPGPMAVKTADFNGDGRLDLVTAGYTQGGVSVLLNTTLQGASTPSFAAAATFGAGQNLRSVAVGDFNGDGKPDVAVVGSDVPTYDVFSATADTVAVLRNTTATGATTATFATRQLLGSDLRDSPRGVTAGDVNNDGKLDLVVTNFESSKAVVYLNATTPGATTFALLPGSDKSTGTNPAGVALADLNGDGKLDVVAAASGLYSGSSMGVSVLLNNTILPDRGAAFVARQDFTTGITPLGVTVGDLNGDGRPDLVVANYGLTLGTGSGDPDSVSVFLNTTSAGSTTATFAAKQDFTVGNRPRSVALADLNNDGRLDLVVANAADDAFSVLLNTTALGSTTASFLAKQDFATVSFPAAMAVGDLNADGRLDLIVVNLTESLISIYLNTTTLGSATASFAARQLVEVGNLPIGVVLADFNGDGRLDAAVVNSTGRDVSVLLNTMAPGATTVTFAALQNFTVAAPMSNQAYSLTAGDLNGDGRPDLVVTTFDGRSAAVLLNTTTAGATTPTFAPAQYFAASTTNIAVAVALADVNGDGKLDLIVNADENSSGIAAVLLNTTAPGATVPSFAAKQNFVLLGSGLVALGDFNGDGLTDAVFSKHNGNTGPGSVSILLNQAAVIAVAQGTGTINLNNAPVLDTAKTPVLNNVAKNAGNPVGPVGTLTSQFVDFKTPAGQIDNVTDADAGALLGVAITRVDTTNGSWFYSINNGTSWLALTASTAAARLLAVNGQTRVYFKPNANFTGIVGQAISFRAWDRTVGTNGGTLDVSMFSASSSFSRLGDTASIAANTAPVLDAARSPVLNLVGKNAGNPVGAVGTLTSQLVDFKTPAGQVDNVTDADPGALLGIAVTAVNTMAGAWFYSLDNGGTWTSFTASTAAARLLAVNGQTRIYFQPDGVVSGTLASAITFRAWDRTAGNNGSTMNVATTGGATPFSTAVDTATIVVNAAPTLDPSKTPVLNNIAKNAANPVGAVGTLVSQLVDFASPAGQRDNVVDGDNGAQLGIAVTKVDTTNGTWFYSLNNGGTWLALTASTTAAKLLAADGSVRLYFKPKAGFTGTVASAISFRAWDQTTGANGGTLDVSTFKPEGTFSRLGDTASIVVI